MVSCYFLCFFWCVLVHSSNLQAVYAGISSAVGLICEFSQLSEKNGCMTSSFNLRRESYSC